MLAYLHQLFSAEQCQAYIHTRAGKIARSSVPVARATPSALGAHTITGQDANAIGVTAVGVPATTRHTLLAQSKRSLGHWILATFIVPVLFIAGIARELGVHLVRLSTFHWAGEWDSLCFGRLFPLAFLRSC